MADNFGSDAEISGTWNDPCEVGGRVGRDHSDDQLGVNRRVHDVVVRSGELLEQEHCPG